MVFVHFSSSVISDLMGWTACVACLLSRFHWTLFRVIHWICPCFHLLSVQTGCHSGNALWCFRSWVALWQWGSCWEHMGTVREMQGGAAGLKPALCVHCQVGTHTTGLQYPGSVWVSSVTWLRGWLHSKKQQQQMGEQSHQWESWKYLHRLQVCEEVLIKVCKAWR